MSDAIPVRDWQQPHSIATARTRRPRSLHGADRHLQGYWNSRTLVLSSGFFFSGPSTSDQESRLFRIPLPLCDQSVTNKLQSSAPRAPLREPKTR